jgi:hypothetical protein
LWSPGRHPDPAPLRQRQSDHGSALPTRVRWPFG